MKANTLRFGNIIKTGFEDIIIVGFSTFKALENNESYFYPIEITEEWLLKFGFQLKDEVNRGYLITTNEYLKESLYCSKDGVVALYSEILENKKDFILKKITYIHQLQNLYFSLTDLELEG